jgi:hypothetical protein
MRIIYSAMPKISKILTDGLTVVNLFVMIMKIVGRRKDGFGRPKRPPF